MNELTLLAGMNTMNALIRSIIYTSLLVLSAINLTHADGGGSSGGGGFPSQSIPSFDPVEKYQEGLLHLQNKNYKKAQKAFKKVLSVARKDANTHHYLGVAYFADNKPKKARRPFIRAIKYNEENILAIGYLGAVYTQLDKQDDANEQQTKLESLKASCDNCAQLNDINKALSLIKNAAQNNQTSHLIDIKPVKSGDSAYLSAVESINKKDYQTALKSLQESANRFGPHPDILTYQGFANRKLGNYDLALSYYQQALTVDKQHRGANEYLGEYFVEIGDLKSANQQLATLEKICDFGCEEAEELRRWIASAKQ